MKSFTYKFTTKETLFWPYLFLNINVKKNWLSIIVVVIASSLFNKYKQYQDQLGPSQILMQWSTI